MKRLLVAIFVLAASVSQATQYDCKLSNGSESDPMAITYSFDTVQENNKFVVIGQGTSVGCVILRTEVPVVGCGIYSENFSVSVSAEDGSSVIGLDTMSSGNKSQLICVKNSKLHISK